VQLQSNGCDFLELRIDRETLPNPVGAKRRRLSRAAVPAWLPPEQADTFSPACTPPPAFAQQP
jgi:hypothetical protein